MRLPNIPEPLPGRRCCSSRLPVNLVVSWLNSFSRRQVVPVNTVDLVAASAESINTSSGFFPHLGWRRPDQDWSSMPHRLVQSNRVAHGFNPRVYRMKVTFGSQVIAAGICGILSFTFLATSLGTEYWYIIDMNPTNMSDSEDLSSHSGLWSINEGALLAHTFIPPLPLLIQISALNQAFPSNVYPVLPFFQVASCMQTSLTPSQQITPSIQRLSCNC